MAAYMYFMQNIVVAHVMIARAHVICSHETKREQDEVYLHMCTCGSAGCLLVRRSSFGECYTVPYS